MPSWESAFRRGNSGESNKWSCLRLILSADLGRASLCLDLSVRSREGGVVAKGYRFWLEWPKGAQVHPLQTIQYILRVLFDLSVGP
jgi:hypothetical protein